MGAGSDETSAEGTDSGAEDGADGSSFERIGFATFFIAVLRLSPAHAEDETGIGRPTRGALAEPFGAGCILVSSKSYEVHVVCVGVRVLVHERGCYSRSLK